MREKDAEKLRKEYDAWLRLLRIFMGLLPLIGMMGVYVAFSVDSNRLGLLSSYLILGGPACYYLRRSLEEGKERFLATVNVMDDVIVDKRFIDALKDALRKNGL